MLYPRRLSEESKENIFAKISLISQHPEVLELSENSSEEDKRKVKKIERFLLDCSIRQYELPDIPRSKIILSNDVYKRLIEYANKSNKRDNLMTEFGGYIYGIEEAPNVVYFKSNNEVQMKSYSGEIHTPKKLSEEIQRVIEDTDADCIAHIHTHPFERSHYYPFPSNQDLYTYGFLQEQFNKTDKDVYFLGGLITPLTGPESPIRINDICFMFYDKKVKRFYKCSNIYYEDQSGNRNPLSRKNISYMNDDNTKVLVKEKRTVLQNLNNI